MMSPRPAPSSPPQRPPLAVRPFVRPSVRPRARPLVRPPVLVPPRPPPSAMMSAAESQPPPQQTAAKTEIGAQASFPKINLQHFRTLPGIVKLVQLAFGIICMACASPAYRQGTHWFLFVATVSFITTLLWVFVYLLSVREELSLPINWVLSELLNTAVDTVLYFIAFVVQLSVWAGAHHSYYQAANITAGVFGIFNTVAYAVGTYFLFVQWKSSRTPN